MLRRIDIIAHTNRWHAKTGAVMLFCAGMMACALCLPPVAIAPPVIVVAWLAAIFGARVPAGAFAKAFVIPMGFLVTGAVVLCISVTWDTAHGLRVALTHEGARTALQTSCRAAAALPVTLLYAFTSPLSQTLALLRRARVPVALIELMGITCRAIFLLDESRASIIGAQQNRLGYRNARCAFRSTGLAAVALFTRTHARAANLERGLQSRCYDDSLAVMLPPAETTRRDYILAITIPACIATLTLLAHTLLFPA
jgi:cobalt/nickel transport system permease protein